MEIENAKITNVSISMANHCSLVFEIGVEGAGWVCNIGGYKMASGMLNEKPENFKAENGAGLVALMRIMDVVGVDRWEDLEGKYCRVKTEGWGGTIYCIGNILKNKWFDINGNPGSISVSQTQRALLMPQEVINLPRDNEIILIEANPPIKTKKIFWYKVKWMSARVRMPFTPLPHQEPIVKRNKSPKKDDKKKKGLPK